MGQLFVPMRQARRRGDENAVSGHLSSRQYAFRRSACWGESCRFVFPIQLKNSVRLENCNPQVAATVVLFGRLNLYARSRNHRRPATDRIALQQTRRNNCVGKVDLDQIHEALLLIDLATGAPGLRSPDPPVSASGPGQGCPGPHGCRSQPLYGWPSHPRLHANANRVSWLNCANPPTKSRLTLQTSEHKTYLRFRVLKVFWTGEFNRLRQTWRLHIEVMEVFIDMCKITHSV